MQTDFEAFVFEGFDFDGETGNLSLRYSLDETIHFEEQWQFPISNFDTTKPPQSPLLRGKNNDTDRPNPKLQIPNPQLKSALQGLWLMCGISYFKAYLPKNIVVKGEPLTQSQAVFFDKIYLHGLGEFFYENQIDPNGLICFPYEKVRERQQDSKLELSGTLIPVGGGKDSLTTIELLKNTTSHQLHATSPLTTWSVGHAELFAPMLELTGLPHLQVQRKICPNLIEANKKGALNGHVPISSILAFSSVVTALLNGKKYIALSNESSANEANTEMYGMEINHQYSKTLEFERDFQAYVSAHISDQVHYFSFLRPLKEIQIAQIFCSKCFEKYLGNFSSCNKNFTLAHSPTRPLANFYWCGKCSKCAFVACIFAPFLDRAQMHELFGCEIFEQEEILQFIPELLGQTDHKPFECVGEYEEVQYAINEAVKTGNWPELEPFANSLPLHSGELCDSTREDPLGDKGDTGGFLLQDFAPHAMPEEFYTVIQDL